MVLSKKEKFPLCDDKDTAMSRKNIFHGIASYPESREHDGAIKWKHFPRYWPFCAGNSPVTGEFPSQRPVTRSIDVFFDLRLDIGLSKQSIRRWFETPLHPLWRHCNGTSHGKPLQWRHMFLMASQMPTHWLFVHQPNNNEKTTASHFWPFVRGHHRYTERGMLSFWSLAALKVVILTTTFSFQCVFQSPKVNIAESASISRRWSKSKRYKCQMIPQ